MTVRVFVSWSGERGKLLAEAICYWLPRVHSSVRPWMSKQIPVGKRWQREVGQRLESTDVGIICVTPENKTAPWLMFEAGALSKRLDHSSVCPVLYELRPDDLVSPLDQFQAIEIDRDQMTHMVLTLNGLLGDDASDRGIVEEAVRSQWSKFQKKLQKVEQCRLPGTTSSIDAVVGALAKGGFPEPFCCNQAFFDHGYETYELYSIVVRTAKRRFLLFGRKNRKLFDRTEYAEFFADLASRRSKGFDFRVLFLDPRSPDDLVERSSYAADFRETLDSAPENAAKRLTDAGVKQSEVCRLYSDDRPCGMMVVDDAVLCAPLHRDADGKVLRTTDCPFSVVSTSSGCGQELLKTFEEYWSRTEPLEDGPSNSMQADART